MKRVSAAAGALPNPYHKYTQTKEAMSCSSPPLPRLIRESRMVPLCCLASLINIGTERSGFCPEVKVGWEIGRAVENKKCLCDPPHVLFDGTQGPPTLWGGRAFLTGFARLHSVGVVPALYGRGRNGHKKERE